MGAAGSGGALKRGIVLPNWEVDGDTERLVEYGVAAEAAGWDGVFLADHLVPGQDFPDPWITLSGIAARTEELRLGSWVTPVPRRQPWQLARDLATLDQLSNGRVMLGTGLGREFDYTTFGEAWEPGRLGERYDEALEVITGLWSGEAFSYDGEHFTVKEAELGPAPQQEPRIPVIVGGVWPNRPPFRRGTRWDGIVPHYRGDGVIPTDGGGITAEPDGALDPLKEVDEMLAYYHDHADEPGEILLPADPPHPTPDWPDWCRERGVTWLYTRPMDDDGEWSLTMERVRAGPPGE